MNSNLLKISSRLFLGGVCKPIQLRNYKSLYSLENLYPNSKNSFNAESIINQKVASNPGQFSGYIPLEGLDVSYCRSSGPGGQNVNKVNTKVEIRFHVPSANWIPDNVKAAFLMKEAGRINKNGYFIVTSEKTRKQMLNQADCIDKIRSSLFSCNKNDYVPTQEEIEIMTARKEKARSSILVDKRRQSLVKRARATPDVHGI